VIAGRREMRNAYKILAEKSEEKRWFGISRSI
jgi:hypothetical protein